MSSVAVTKFCAYLFCMVGSVDPPPDCQVEHIWQFALTGLPNGDTVALLDARGREQMRGVAISSETMYLSACLARAGERAVYYVGVPIEKAKLEASSLQNERRKKGELKRIADVAKSLGMLTESERPEASNLGKGPSS